MKIFILVIMAATFSSIPFSVANEGKCTNSRKYEGLVDGLWVVCNPEISGNSFDDQAKGCLPECPAVGKKTCTFSAWKGGYIEGRGWRYCSTTDGFYLDQEEEVCLPKCSN